MKRIVYHSGMGLVIVLLLAAEALAAPALITDIRYWLAPDHIQTVLTFDRAVRASSHFRTRPDRFVLEIPACQSVHGDYAIAVNDIVLKRIRIQRLNSGTMQVVFDLTEKIEASVQTVPSADGIPDHVIVNLFDPAHERQQQPQQALQPVQDATRRPSATRVNHGPKRIVVLDPGHGGRDPGAIGPTGLKEKDVVLDLARKIKYLLEKQSPAIDVYLTRNDDTFLKLPKRTEIAREYQANLFISLHANANRSSRARGFSVYTLSDKATDAAARKLAEKENAVDVLFADAETPTTGEDSLLAFVLADLSTSAALQHSLEFGHIAVDHTAASLSKYHIRKEGLRRANFIVLRTADMPSVLVEACYITNHREESLLRRKDFRMSIAKSLADSIVEYFGSMQHLNQQQVVQTPDSPNINETSPSGYRVHVVKSGESLSLIAGKYHVNVTQLCQVNGIPRADRIYVGQRLRIP